MFAKVNFSHTVRLLVLWGAVIITRIRLHHKVNVRSCSNWFLPKAKILGYARRLVQGIGLLGLGLILLPNCWAVGVPSAKPMLPIQYWVTVEGARVYFVALHQLPIVDIQILYPAGSSRDGANFGVALLTNKLLNDGAADYNADQLAQGFANVGAIFNNTCIRDTALISLRSLSDSKILATATHYLLQIINKPTFPAAAFLREQKNTLTAIEQQLQSPAAIANNAFFELLYHDHPYGHPVLGTQVTVSKLTRDEVVQFYKQFYVVNNAAIVLVGDLSRQTAEQLAAQLSAAMPKGAIVKPLPLAKPSRQANTKIIPFPSEQTHILMGQVGITRDNPEYYKWYMGNQVLGGQSFASKLFENVREKHGFAYAVYSNILPMLSGGPFSIGLQTRTDQAQAALAISLQTLQDFIVNGPSTQQLQLVQKNLAGSLPLTVDSNAAITSMVGNIAFSHLPLDYLDTFVTKTATVTSGQVKQAFERLLNIKQLVIVMVGKINPTVNTNPKMPA